MDFVKILNQLHNLLSNNNRFLFFCCWIFEKNEKSKEKTSFQSNLIQFH